VVGAVDSARSVASQETAGVSVWQMCAPGSILANSAVRLLGECAADRVRPPKHSDPQGPSAGLCHRRRWRATMTRPVIDSMEDLCAIIRAAVHEPPDTDDMAEDLACYNQFRSARLRHRP
jgi:hypothetical protein